MKKPRSTLAIALAGGIVLTPSPAWAIPGEGIAADFVGDRMSSAFEEAASGMVGWVLSGVEFFANGVANFLKTAGRPEVEAVWFSGPSSPYASVRSIAVALLLGFTLLGIITGLLHGDVAGMLRRIAGTLPAAVIGMITTTVVVAKLLDLTDALSTAVLSGSGAQPLEFLTKFGALSAIPQAGFAAFLIGMAAVLAGFLLWIELLIRAALIYFLVALSPLAFVAMLWPATRGILRKLIEFLVAAIVSKLVICIALAIGAAALSSAGGSAPNDAGTGEAAAMTMGRLLSGTALLVLAGYSPFLLLRMIPLVESVVVAQGISRGPARAARSGIGAASSVSSVTRLAGSSSIGRGSIGRASGSSTRLGGDRPAAPVYRRARPSNAASTQLTPSSDSRSLHTDVSRPKGTPS